MPDSRLERTRSSYEEAEDLLSKRDPPYQEIEDLLKERNRYRDALLDILFYDETSTLEGPLAIALYALLGED